MLNEIEEFNAYTSPVIYTAESKRDTSYLGRFTFDSFLEFRGLSRVLTIIARGYMFETETPDTERARRALCAWCSMPEMKKATPNEEWQFKADFRYLHGEFPGLVDSKGNGWYFRHIKSVADYIRSSPDKVNLSVVKKADLLGDKFDREWRKKLMQFQYHIFTPHTESRVMTFDSIVADALVLGPLKDKTVILSQETLKRINELNKSGAPDEVIVLLIQYYLANKPDDSEWVVLPTANFDMYFGNTNFSKKWLKQIPESIIIRDTFSFGVGRYKVVI